MRRASLVLCAAVCIAACGGSTEPTPNPVGTYSLVSIGGSALPVLTTISDSTRVVTGAITLRADARFVVTETDSIWIGSVVPHYYQRQVHADSGNWVLGVGSVVNLQFGGPRSVGFLSGSEIRFASGQGNWIYRKP